MALTHRHCAQRKVRNSPVVHQRRQIRKRSVETADLFPDIPQGATFWDAVLSREHYRPAAVSLDLNVDGIKPHLTTREAGSVGIRSVQRLELGVLEASTRLLGKQKQHPDRRQEQHPSRTLVKTWRPSAALSDIAAIWTSSRPRLDIDEMASLNSRSNSKQRNPKPQKQRPSGVHDKGRWPVVPTAAHSKA